VDRADGDESEPDLLQDHAVANPWSCDRCGIVNDAAADFCYRCGADGQSAKRSANQEGMNPWTAAAAAPGRPEAAAAPGSVTRPAAGETIEQRYMRQTRNATVFIAWIVGIIFAANLIIGIIVARAVMHANTTAPSPSSTCMSQGGFDPSC
jgi:hypothetical protein